MQNIHHLAEGYSLHPISAPLEETATASVPFPEKQRAAESAFPDQRLKGGKNYLVNTYGIRLITPHTVKGFLSFPFHRHITRGAI